MKILYVLKHNPWGIGGGCYATKSYLYAFLSVFSDAEFQILICKEYLKDVPSIFLESKRINFIPSCPLTRFNSIVELFHHSNHRHRKNAKKILKDNFFDFCIFDHSSLAGSIIKYVPQNIRTIVIHHNYEPQYFKDNNSKIRSLILGPIVSFNEKNAFKKCTYNIFLTQEDEYLFQQKYGRKNNTFIIGGFEYDKIEVKSFESVENKIVITGSLSNVQNIDGILDYLNNYHRLIPKEYFVLMAGKSPSIKIVDIVKRYPNINLIASPRDMKPIVQNAIAYICPTRLGSGIKIRIKDALRNGIPVLAHEVSARGYSDFVKAGLMMTYNDKNSFKYGLLKILNFSNVERREIYELFCDKFSFEKACQRISLMVNLKTKP